MSTLLPTDINNNPIPVLRLRPGYASVTATNADHYLPADTYMDISVAGNNTQSYTHIAAIRASSDGTLYVSEKF